MTREGGGEGGETKRVGGEGVGGRGWLDNKDRGGKNGMQIKERRVASGGKDKKGKSFKKRMRSKAQYKYEQ